MAVRQVYSTIPDVPQAVRIHSPVVPPQRIAQDGVNVVLTTPKELIHLLPSIKRISKSKLVYQVSTENGDHSQVTALRSSGLALVYSPNEQQARQNAVVANTIATSGNAVLHFGEFPVIADLASSSSSSSSKAANGHLNGSAPAEPFSAAFASAGSAPLKVFGAQPAETQIIALGHVEELANALPPKHGLVSLSLYRPLSANQIRHIVGEQVKNVVVLEQTYSRTNKWGPLFLDVVGAFAESDATPPTFFSGTLGRVANAKTAVAAITDAVKAGSHTFNIGELPTAAASTSASSASVPKHETTYTNLLSEIFDESLSIVNARTLLPPSTGASHVHSTSPEYALGHVLGSAKELRTLRQSAQAALQVSSIEPELSQALSAWLQDDRDAKKAKAVQQALSASKSKHETIEALRQRSTAFARKSHWIVGSEAWSHDLGASGLHHALSTGADVNLLLIDTTPYALPDADSSATSDRRKDAGLYAMNYGNAYVASVAAYGDFSQTLRAMSEADRFNGPSVIMAYLPGGEKDETSPLDLLKSTKKAIEIGTWPLYRWDPKAEERNAEVFQLDSEKIKSDLREFLDRQSHLTELANRLPKFGSALESGELQPLIEAQKRKARAAFDALSSALEGPPLLVLFASDGGNAEKLAKKFTTRARQRGVAARCLAFDDMPIDDLPLEQNAVFFTSVAGQGEFPQNGRELWKALSSGKVSSLSTVNVSVFGLGDSHYWPRKEDAHFYNKSGKDLWAKLLDLGAQTLVEIGLGDDQDPDGFQTGYKLWEPQVWKALGVDDFQTNEPELEPISNEHIKIASNYLRGTVKEGLEDTTTGALAESDGQITKFHGIYQQDDRDIRDERKAAGLEPAYSFMVRMRLPAGVCTPAQWLAVDEISDKRGNHTFKLTTRQTFQFHGIIKSNLKPAIQEINKMALDTIAACGDVNRTVMCSCNPSLGALHDRVFAFSRELSDGLKPQTSAYAEIWLDKKMVAGDAVKDVEPLYGEYYLPRKFKIAIAVPPTNDVDVYCHDLGFIAIVDERKQLLGFNVTVGGGMGVTHSMKTTYPRLADVIGFVKPEEGLEVAKAVLTTQRDNGNRANRKNARVKYTIDRMGLDAFKAEVERRFGKKLEAARPFEFTSNVDEFGWQTGEDGKRHFTCFVENGRVQDEPGRPYKTGLREIARAHKGLFRLTPNQHLIIADVAPEDEATIQQLLKKYHLDSLDYSALRLSSAACVAFPTCGLAMAESERYLPILIDKVERLLEESGLRNDSITMRMTGCPNGCARPWAAEVAFVGKAPGSYLMLLGGGYHGQRLNKIYRESVTEREILDILKPMIKAYASERLDGERFGDFVIRKGYITATKSGKEFYDGMNPGLAAAEGEDVKMVEAAA